MGGRNGSMPSMIGTRRAATSPRTLPNNIPRMLYRMVNRPPMPPNRGSVISLLTWPPVVGTATPNASKTG